MTEIKSSLEIALERAAAMAGDAPDQAEEEEGRTKGEVIVRRALADDLSPQDLRKILEGLGEQAGSVARKTAVEGLAQAAAGQPAQALPILRELAADPESRELVEKITEAVQKLQDANASVQMELMEQMRSDYAAVGVSGSAVYPNPRSHPDYQDRLKDAGKNMLSEISGLQEKLVARLK